MEIKIRKDFVTELKSAKELIQLFEKDDTSGRVSAALRSYLSYTYRSKGINQNETFWKNLQKKSNNKLLEMCLKDCEEIKIIEHCLYMENYPFHLFVSEGKYYLVSYYNLTPQYINNKNTLEPNAEYVTFNINGKLIEKVSDIDGFIEVYIKNYPEPITNEEVKEGIAHSSTRWLELPFKICEQRAKQCAKGNYRQPTYDENIKELLKYDKNLKKLIKNYGAEIIDKYLIFHSEYYPDYQFIILPTVEDEIILLRTSRFSKREIENYGGKIRDIPVKTINVKSVA